MKLSAHRAELPGNVNMFTGSALTPLRESVTALPVACLPAGNETSSRPARDQEKFKSFRLHLTPFSGEYYNASQETEEFEVPRACLRRSGFAQAGTARGFPAMIYHPIVPLPAGRQGPRPQGGACGARLGQYRV